MIAAALLAFVLAVSLLQDRSVTTPVLVAEVDILPGTPITPDLVTEVEIAADSDLIGSVATLDSIVANDVSAGHRISAGDPITMTAIAPASTPASLRAMSIPIDRVDAVGGDLTAGDRIDVISVEDGNAGYVATGLEVLRTPSSDIRTGALGSSATSKYFVVVSVDDRTALAITLAQEVGRVSIVRSTGAAEIPADRRLLIEPAGTAPGGAVGNATDTEGGSEGADGVEGG